MGPPADFGLFTKVPPVPGRFVSSHHAPGLLVEFLALVVLLVFLLLNLVLVGSISAPFLFVEKCWNLARRARRLLAVCFAHPVRFWDTLVENRKRKRQERWLQDLRHWLSTFRPI